METDFTEFTGLTSFDYLDCTTKEGEPFIKIIRYDNDASGYVEVARVKPSKSKYLDGADELEEIFIELKENNKARCCIRESLLNDKKGART